MSRITVTTKVDEIEYERLKMIASSKGMSLCGYFKSLCEKEIEGKSDIEDGLNEIAFLYDIDGENLVKNVRWMLDSGKIFVKDGRLHWNPLAMNPEYISLDDKVDLMNLSNREKDKLKRTIADNIEKMARQDDIGNGGGL